MIDGTEKRKPGRPRKAINLGCEERDVGDASLEKVEKYADSIFDVMTKQKPFAEHFKHLDLTSSVPTFFRGARAVEARNSYLNWLRVV